MGRKVCDYCGGSGRDAVSPSTHGCYKCHGTGTVWEADPPELGVKPTSLRGSRAEKDRGSYQPLAFTQRMLDAVPKWLNVTLAIIGAFLGVVIGQRVDPSNNIVILGTGGFGTLLGYYSLPLLIGFADITVQLITALIKLAIVLGVTAGVLYFIWVALGET